MAKARRQAEELPIDNTARIVLFDAMAKAIEEEPGFDGLTEPELFDRVLPRLRVLVPRELHNLGEQQYVTAKVEACVGAGVLRAHPYRDGAFLPGPNAPRTRYPDTTIRDYTAGLEVARERLDADEGRLRQAGFDVRDIVRSPADAKKSDGYQALVASMREHGFLDGFPIIDGTSGIVDGVARLAAAAEAEVSLKSRHRVTLPPQRDTPLQIALLVLDVNAARLQTDDVAAVHDAIAKRTGRPWSEIDRDLDITRDWRRAEPKDYGATFEVELVHYLGRDEPKVQVTRDGTRVALRSLTREAGISEWGRDDLEPYVPFEYARARSRGGGKKAIFVRIADAVRGIERMGHDRARRGLRVDPAWEEVRQWLLSLEAGVGQDDAPAGATAPRADSGADSPGAE